MAASEVKAQKVVVPDFLRNWPVKRVLNRHYQSVGAESREWIHGWKLFDARSSKAFDRCDFQKIAMLSYPYHDAARSRTCCDLMGLLYVFDEYTDVGDAAITREMADAVMDGLRNPSKPQSTSVGKVASSFWGLGRRTASPMAERHFLATFQQYVDSVVQEAEARDSERLLTIEEYKTLRRHTSACLPSFALIELDLDFPEEVYNHPLLDKLRELALCSIYALNDVYSYPVERARGTGLVNLVTIAMFTFDVDPQGAVDWIGAWHDDMVEEFAQCKAELFAQSWGADVDAQVKQYVHGLECWVRANLEWTFESQRYFGTRGLEIRQSGTLDMMPRVDLATARLESTDGVEKDAAAMDIRADLSQKVEVC